MKKILIRLRVPAAEETYDLFVPTDMQISKIIESAIDGVMNLNDGKFRTTGNEMLMTDGMDYPFNSENTLADYAVHDGDQLTMI